MQENDHLIQSKEIHVLPQCLLRKATGLKTDSFQDFQQFIVECVKYFPGG